MKHSISFRITGCIVLLCLTIITITAQPPRGFHYQAVARDENRAVLANNSITVYINLRAQSGSVIWEEQHGVTTNGLGMFSIEILNDDSKKTGGSAGNLEDIDWSSGQYSLDVAIDPGNGLIDLGNYPLMSVPYANTALDDGDKDPHNEIQHLQYSGNTLRITDGNSVILSGGGDDGDPTNEIQDLGLSGDVLTITNNPQATPINLAAFNAQNVGWSRVGDQVVYLNGNVGVGTVTPGGRLSVQGVDESDTEPLFMVRRKDGYPVFAVYEHGVYAYTDTVDTGKGIKGGFAVGGYRTEYKGTGQEYMRVNADSIRFYVNQDPDSKGVKGGFAVGGYTTHYKSPGDEFLRVTPDSVRIYIDDTPDSKGLKGGFAVGGYTTHYKGPSDQYFNISASSTPALIDEEKRIVWYPVKDALLAGTVHVGGVDSVGLNSAALGYKNVASGRYSQAFGYRSQAKGNYSMAVGNEAVAGNNNSFAFGEDAFASLSESYALGRGAQALGYRSFAIGSAGVDSTGATTEPPKALEDYSFAIGQGSVSLGEGGFSFGLNDSAVADYSMALGYSSTAYERMSTAIGMFSRASGYGSVAVGSSYIYRYNTGPPLNMWLFDIIKNHSSGDYSSAFGMGNTATGAYASALGFVAEAHGDNSTSIGSFTKAYGNYSTALGYMSESHGAYSLSFGRSMKVYGTHSVGIALNTSGYSLNQNNTFSIMGGRIGIGTLTPGTPLAIAGLTGTTSGAYLRIYNNNVYYYSSSRATKTNIRQLEENFRKILHARPVKFTDRTTGEENIGYIAEDFEDLGLENLVVYQNGKPMSLSYELVSLYNLEIIKEQQAALEKKNEEIAGLHNEIEALKQRMESIESKLFR